MADIKDLVAKYVPKNDAPIAGEDTFFDEKNNTVVVRNAFGTSLYDSSGNLLYGQGALYDTNIGSVSGKNVQIFGRNDEIGLAASGVEGAGDQARIERQRKEAAYGAGGSKGLGSYLNTGGVLPGTPRNFATSGFTASDGKTFTNLSDQLTYQATLDKAKNERQSAYDLLYSEFNKYGLGTLVTPLKDLIQKGVSPSEFTIELRNSPQYQTRFAANAKRIQSGLSALNEAQYIGLEDQYQNIMRNYGLPEQYYARGDLGVQAGFEKFIANDVSPTELEDRIQTAERRVRFANPEVGIALKTFYPDITNGDVLAYALDPKTALESLKRRITAAEVGSTAVQMGLATNVTDAEYLARYGVTKQTAQQGYNTIAGGLQRGSQLASIYGEDPYTQTTAEREVFGVPGAQEAKAQRQKIIGLEKATFGGQSGVSSSALARDRAGNF